MSKQIHQNLAAISAAALIAGGMLAAASAQAAPVTPSLVLVDGDKEFSLFSCMAGATDCDGAGIGVDATPLAGTETGIRFDFTNYIVSTFASQGINLGYEVAVTDPDKRIVGIETRWGAIVPDGDVGFAKVTTTAVFDAAIVMNTQLTVDPLGNIEDVSDPVFEATDTELTGIYGSLSIVHDLLAIAGFTDAQITFLEVSFIQAEYNVPAPAGLGLVLAGSAAFLRRRLRKS